MSTAESQIDSDYNLHNVKTQESDSSEASDNVEAQESDSSEALEEAPVRTWKTQARGSFQER
ncbi:hypothetical protein PtA15_8A298 [Puccinia triticina]|uniref:Uncharacterized protein n=1 Tax=Puccinia triticina TaxID=208348 RepID=A0ABY7CQC0_9BASI|nr:uncharacterized protein PtA15_8A298 [Puccinia triticina]WAQ87394.1 hypothetical protein PtA15_8A298 [Puccinia triticina]